MPWPLVPVSYTHLPDNNVLESKISMKFKQGLMVCCLLCCALTVSYTHLDVYKRQVHRSRLSYYETPSLKNNGNNYVFFASNLWNIETVSYTHLPFSNVCRLSLPILPTNWQASWNGTTRTCSSSSSNW